MAKDLKVDDKGDLVINPETHDLEMIDGVDEIAQRIKATLEIRYGEMEELDPKQGTDYSAILGKHFDKTMASDEIRNVIMEQVPEVESVDNIEFTPQPNRGMTINFKAIATPTDGNSAEEVEGDVDFGI